MITFNGILRAENVDPDTVLLVRHQDGRSKGSNRTPFNLWRTDLEALELYQSIQRRDLFPIGSSLASFVGTPAGETLFIGLYTVVERGVVPSGTIDPVSGENVEGLHLYRLDGDQCLDAYRGRLFIDWGLGFRSWVQKAQRQDKPILELRRTPDIKAIAAFAEKFANRHFSFGEWAGGETKDGVIQMPWFNMSEEAIAFEKAAYDGQWVLDEFSWVQWKESEEANRLVNQPGRIERANIQQLARLLTVLIRSNRFSDGTLNDAFQSGLLPRIVGRAAVLAAS